MDSVSIVDERGALLENEVTFVRGPAVGEWVAVRGTWVQVVAVAHGRSAAGPALRIQVDSRTRPKVMDMALLTDTPAGV